MKRWAWLCLFALALMALPPAYVFADEAPAVSISQDEKPVPLIINRKVITVFRSSFMGLTPSQRAAGARDRIREFLSEYGYDTIGVRATAQGTAVTIHDDVMFLITPGDIRGIPGANLLTTAEEAADELKSLQYREKFDKLLKKLSAFRISPKSLLIFLGLLGLVGIIIYWVRSVMFPQEPSQVNCPKCGNVDESQLKYQEELSSLRMMRKYYCENCGHKWLVRG